MSAHVDGSRTVAGAASGIIAAAVWALQQPLDKALFQSRYDDVELLGRAVVGEKGWYPAGLAWHLVNAALFGAVYANLSPLIPVPRTLRGPAAGLTEHLALWPLAAVSDRVHPAREKLPALSGNRRAFAQATWRHLLFGAVLGEIERRLTANAGPSTPEPTAHYSSNGHGSLEHAVSVES